MSKREGLILNHDLLSNLKLQADIASLSYDTEVNPSSITKWANEHNMIFDPYKDSFSNLNTNSSFICLRKKVNGEVEVYLGFRGTIITSLSNIEEDIDMTFSYFYGTKVSSGFLKAWMSLRKYAVTLLDKYKPKRLYITGHSLGASIAVLAALDLKISFGYQSVLYTFASPRTGDESFVKLFTSTLGQSYRVEGINDPIPRFPTILQGYVHIPTQILLNNGECTVGGPPPTNYPWNIKYHFIKEYIQLLNSLPSEGCKN